MRSSWTSPVSTMTVAPRVRIKWPIGTCATTKKSTLFYHTMARIRSQKAQKKLVRHYTPPPELANYKGHAKTPQRSAVFACRALAAKKGISITRDDIHEITGVVTRVQTRILESKQLRTRHNYPDSGPWSKTISQTVRYLCNRRLS